MHDHVRSKNNRDSHCRSGDGKPHDKGRTGTAYVHPASQTTVTIVGGCLSGLTSRAGECLHGVRDFSWPEEPRRGARGGKIVMTTLALALDDTRSGDPGQFGTSIAQSAFETSSLVPTQSSSFPDDAVSRLSSAPPILLEAG